MTILNCLEVLTPTTRILPVPALSLVTEAVLFWLELASLNRAPTWPLSKKSSEAVRVVSPFNAPAVMLIPLVLITPKGPSSALKATTDQDRIPRRWISMC